MQFVCITICHNFYGCVKNTFDFLGRMNVICQSKVEFVVWTKWDWFIQIKSNYIATKSLSQHSRLEISNKKPTINQTFLRGTFSFQPDTNHQM